MTFVDFKTGYWNYYIELEKRMEETRRFVEFDNTNSNTFSSNYLILLQAVCSEIDNVGKEIASYFNNNFENEKGKKYLNRWWYEVQDNLPGLIKEVKFAGSLCLQPWNKYRVSKVEYTRETVNGITMVTHYNLSHKEDGVVYEIPKWWNAYNKVKHKRLEVEKDEVNYKKANLINLANAFAALYLLEFEFMKKIATEEEIIKCARSTLFGMGAFEKDYINGVLINNGNISFC